MPVESCIENKNEHEERTPELNIKANDIKTQPLR